LSTSDRQDDSSLGFSNRRAARRAPVRPIVSPPALDPEVTAQLQSAVPAKSKREPLLQSQAPRLVDLVHKRLRKFSSLLSAVLSQEDPETVHDLRVWSRRLQQAVATRFPKPRPERIQAVLRSLRRARQAVSGWRDCDVLIDLLDRRIRRMRNPEGRRAWEIVRDSVSTRRDRELRRARRKLANRRLFAVSDEVGKLIEVAAHDHVAVNPAVDDTAAVLADAIARAYGQWRESLSRARTESDHRDADLHAFRIQTKRLRYRIELARDLGAVGVDRALEFLKSIQDRLGRMHDRTECALMAAEALAVPDLLLKEPLSAALLLRRLAKEQQLQRAETDEILNAAVEGAHAIERWVEEYGGRLDQQSRQVQSEPDAG
jgi:CHAD domain-containing protein